MLKPKTAHGGRLSRFWVLGSGFRFEGLGSPNHLPKADWQCPPLLKSFLSCIQKTFSLRRVGEAKRNPPLIGWSTACETMGCASLHPSYRSYPAESFAPPRLWNIPPTRRGLGRPGGNGKNSLFQSNFHTITSLHGDAYTYNLIIIL